MKPKEIYLLGEAEFQEYVLSNGANSLISVTDDIKEFIQLQCRDCTYTIGKCKLNDEWEKKQGYSILHCITLSLRTQLSNALRQIQELKKERDKQCGN